MAAIAHDLLPAHAAPRLRCLLLCDLANSTALIERLGDARAAELIRRHDRLVRELLPPHHGQEIDKTDGFLILFERPIQAVAFALKYQRQLKQVGAELGEPLRGRVGIHVGEVLAWDNRAEDIAAGAKPVEVEGLAKAVAARLMGLAKSGQILLSETGYSLASRAREELETHPQVQWRDHGRYRFKGVAASMHVFEVGEAGIAPLVSPSSRGKAKRLLPWWRWKPLYALLLLSVLAVPGYYALQPKPAIAFAERDWVVLANLQNLTGDGRFDGAVDTALRIGLEQSRHVNVLANLKRRDVLTLMRRDPDGTVDREIGNEIAQRIGARAVLVPSLAEIGGRLRFTLELVDPRSGTTVYTRAAEASHEGQILHAIEAALREARRDLGESMKSIESSSRGLAQVTSASLEALRAYTLAVESRRKSQLLEALRLAEQAVELDPGFAMAYTLIASLRNDEGDVAGALRAVESAEKHSERLSVREQMFLRAASATLRGEPAAVGRWQALAQIYPDLHRAHFNYAYYRYQFDNDAQAALDLLWPSLVSTNATLGSSKYLAGRLLLGLDRVDEALAAFAESVEFGVAGILTDFAYAHLAAGDVAAGTAALQHETDSGMPAQELERKIWPLFLQLDRGERVAAAHQALQLAEQARDLSASLELRFLAFAAAAALRDDRELALQAADALVQRSFQAWGASELQLARNELGANLAVAAWIAARVGAIEPGQAWLAGAEKAVPPSELHRYSRDVIGLAKAELAMAAGLPHEAERALAPQLDGKELYLTHSLLLRLAQLRGDAAGLQTECDWLRARPGRALLEYLGKSNLAAANWQATRCIP